MEISQTIGTKTSDISTSDTQMTPPLKEISEILCNGNAPYVKKDTTAGKFNLFS
jgi:hypothetical protein